MPLAFFCTLFFRHRKKSVSAPRDGQSQSAPESARQSPSKGNFLRQSCLLSMQCRGLSARPLHPFGSPAETIECPMGRQVPIRAGVGASGPAGGRVCTCGRTKGLSARFGSPPEAIEHPIELQALLPRRSRRVISRRGRRMRPQFPRSAEFPLAQRNDFRYTLGNRAATVPRPTIKGLRAKAPGIFLF